MITYFGIAESDGSIQPNAGVNGSGIKVYPRPIPQNFIIVVEAGKGPNNFDVGTSVYNPSGRPDLQIESNRPLGNGSTAVCDNRLPDLGGVPQIDPESYDPSSQMISDALNDLGCRFIVHRPPGELPCTRDSHGNDAYVSSSTAVQFCYEPAVGTEMAFPVGDTILTVRVRNVQGGLGDPAQIDVRVAPQ